MELKDLLRDLQGDRSQQEFAQIVGINQSTVSKLRRGKRGVGPGVLRALVRAFPERESEITRAFFAYRKSSRTEFMTS